MKKISVILTLVLLTTLVIATPVFAGNGNGNGSGQSRGTGGRVATVGGQQNFSLVGTITAVGSDTITIQTINARFTVSYNRSGIWRYTSVPGATDTGRVAISLSGCIGVDKLVTVKGKWHPPMAIWLLLSPLTYPSTASNKALSLE